MVDIRSFNVTVTPGTTLGPIDFTEENVIDKIDAIVTKNLTNGDKVVSIFATIDTDSATEQHQYTIQTIEVSGDSNDNISNGSLVVGTEIVSSVAIPIFHSNNKTTFLFITASNPTGATNVYSTRLKIMEPDNDTTVSTPTFTPTSVTAAHIIPIFINGNINSTVWFFTGET